MKLNPLSRLGAALAALVLLVHPADATWSIVVVDRSTGEVAIASATCLANTDLAALVPVLHVGAGAVAAQAQVSPNFVKAVAKQGLKAGDTPHQILIDLWDVTSESQRQFGIVAFSGPPISWSGSGVCGGKNELHGYDGDLAYAVQGNLLVGQKPVTAARDALLETPGDLSQKLMAAMQAARELGGDGRCSCDLYQPGGPCGNPGGTACGAPPEGFDPETDKSAHTAFLIVSRIGDLNAGCNPQEGCAHGDYFLNIEFNGGANDPDPVAVLQMLYDTWRADLAGRPDGIFSTATPRVAAVPADGVSLLPVHLELVDVDGVPLASGGATITATALSDRPPRVEYLDAEDHGDGTYTLLFRATDKAGGDEWRIQVDDGRGRLVTLHPDLELATLPAER